MSTIKAPINWREREWNNRQADRRKYVSWYVAWRREERYPPFRDNYTQAIRRVLAGLPL